MSHRIAKRHERDRKQLRRCVRRMHNQEIKVEKQRKFLKWKTKQAVLNVPHVNKAKRSHTQYACQAVIR